MRLSKYRWTFYTRAISFNILVKHLATRKVYRGFLAVALASFPSFALATLPLPLPLPPLPLPLELLFGCTESGSAAFWGDVKIVSRIFRSSCESFRSSSSSKSSRTPASASKSFSFSLRFLQKESGWQIWIASVGSSHDCFPSLLMSSFTDTQFSNSKKCR